MTSTSNEFDMTLNSTELAVELTMAWLGNPNTRADSDQVSAFMTSMKSQVDALAAGSSADAEPEAMGPSEGAVSVRKSLASPDHIISMIDGKPYKTLRRHLSSNGMTPQQYRERFGLKDDYPMVARNYSEARRDMAKRIGLGRKPASPQAVVEPTPAPAPVAAPEPVAAPAPRRRGRPPRSAQA